MEQLNQTEAVTETAEPVCAACGNPGVVEGHSIALCKACRAKYINYPIPMWVKIFGAAVVLVMLISMIWLPGNIKAAIALERAETAEYAHNYLTEQRELEKARVIVPGSKDVLGHLMIASLNNNDLTTFASAINDVKDKTFDDSLFLKRLELISVEANNYFPSVAYNKYFAAYKDGVVPDTALRHYLKDNPNDIYALFNLAVNYANRESYPAMDTVLSAVLNVDAGFIPALMQKAMVKRELGQADSSDHYCDLLLANNHQCLYAISSKARNLLKAGKNRQGLQMALQCAALDKQDRYNMATLAMAYHFNNNYKQRDQIVRAAERDTALAQYMTFVKDVIDNKVNYQTKISN